MLPAATSFIGNFNGKSSKFFSKQTKNVDQYGDSDSDISITTYPLNEDDSGSDYKVADSTIGCNYSMDTTSCATSDSEITIDHEDHEENEEISYMIDDDKVDIKKIEDILGKDTFINDYVINLFEEEKSNNSLSWFNDKIMNSKHNARKTAIEWIRNTSIAFKLRHVTLFKTMYYFEKLSSIKQLNPSHLIMIAAVCLFISCKFNEREYDIPSLNKISRACDNNYHISAFASSEIKILSALNFRLKIVLPIDFIQYYIHQNRVIFDDDLIDNCCASDLNLKHIKQDLEKFCVFFLHISAENYSFWNYTSSILAFAVICASRRTMKIKPYFTKKLINVCQYQPKCIQDCFNKLWSQYKTKFPQNASKVEAIQPKSIVDF